MILPAHTQRLIRNRGMAALYGIAAEHDCDLSDVLDILVTAPFSAPESTASNPSKTQVPEPFSRLQDTTPSQPEVLTHAPAAQTDGAAEPPVPTEPSVDLSGLAAHEQGPIPSPAVPPAGDAADGQAETLLSEPSVALDTEAPTPLPEGRGQRASVVKTRPAEAKTSEHEDGGAVSAVKGANARLENAEGVEPPPSHPSKPITNRQRVRECHEAHPDWTAAQIADAIGLGTQQVRVIAHQIGVKPARAAPAKPQEAVEPPPAPKAQPEPEQPPEVRSVAARPVTAPNEPRRVVTTRAPVGAGPSTRFYVRDDRGRYLHQSLERSPTDTGPLMTINRKWAWFDNAHRFAGACRKWPEIADMRKEFPNAR